eukprot:SAG31_NODE_39645_length_286_cov_1.427807_1_plen_26_part_10
MPNPYEYVCVVDPVGSAGTGVGEDGT